MKLGKRSFPLVPNGGLKSSSRQDGLASRDHLTSKKNLSAHDEDSVATEDTGSSGALSYVFPEEDDEHPAFMTRIRVGTQDAEGCTPPDAPKYKANNIWEACKIGDEEVVRETIENSPELIYRTEHGRTPLYLAALCGHLTIMKLLLDAGARDTDGTIYSLAHGDCREILTHYPYQPPPQKDLDVPNGPASPTQVPYETPVKKGFLLSSLFSVSRKNANARSDDQDEVARVNQSQQDAVLHLREVSRDLVEEAGTLGDQEDCFFDDASTSTGCDIDSVSTFDSTYSKESYKSEGIFSSTDAIFFGSTPQHHPGSTRVAVEDEHEDDEGIGEEEVVCRDTATQGQSSGLDRVVNTDCGSEVANEESDDQPGSTAAPKKSRLHRMKKGGAKNLKRIGVAAAGLAIVAGRTFHKKDPKKPTEESVCDTTCSVAEASLPSEALEDGYPSDEGGNLSDEEGIECPLSEHPHKSPKLAKLRRARKALLAAISYKKQKREAEEVDGSNLEGQVKSEIKVKKKVRFMLPDPVESIEEASTFGSVSERDTFDEEYESFDEFGMFTTTIAGIAGFKCLDKEDKVSQEEEEDGADDSEVEEEESMEEDCTTASAEDVSSPAQNSESDEKENDGNSEETGIDSPHGPEEAVDDGNGESECDTDWFDDRIAGMEDVEEEGDDVSSDDCEDDDDDDDDDEFDYYENPIEDVSHAMSEISFNLISEELTMLFTNEDEESDSDTD